MAAGDDGRMRLLARADYALDGCWLWKNARNNAGYGSMYLDGRKVLAHRAAFTLWRGPIPEGLQIDHLCRVKHCVNPDHLEAVTGAENVRRGMPYWGDRKRTHCHRGHELTEANSVWNVGRGRPQRRCRACTNDTAHVWAQANHERRAAQQRAYRRRVRERANGGG